MTVAPATDTPATKASTLTRRALLCAGLAAGLLSGCAVSGFNYDPVYIEPRFKTPLFRIDAKASRFIGRLETPVREAGLLLAVQNAMTRSGVAGPAGKRRVRLEVEVIRVTTPSFGESFETTAECWYTVTDLDNGRVYFDAKVATRASSSIFTSLVSSDRYADARNKALQDNVENFVDRLVAKMKGSAR